MYYFVFSDGASTLMRHPLFYVFVLCDLFLRKCVCPAKWIRWGGGLSILKGKLCIPK